jgi:hypothetical protein
MLSLSLGTYGGTAGESSCSNCTGGTHIDIAGSTSCLDCEAGTYSVGGGSRNCSSCHELASAPQRSTSEGCLCNTGYSGDGVLACNPCKEGSELCLCKNNYYGDPKGDGCNPCPRYSVSQEGSKTISECNCLAGYYAGMLQSTMGCLACPAGSRSEAGSTDASQCVKWEHMKLYPPIVMPRNVRPVLVAFVAPGQT